MAAVRSLSPSKSRADPVCGVERRHQDPCFRALGHRGLRLRAADGAPFGAGVWRQHHRPSRQHDPTVGGLRELGGISVMPLCNRRMGRPCVSCNETSLMAVALAQATMLDAMVGALDSAPYGGAGRIRAAEAVLRLAEAVRPPPGALAGGTGPSPRRRRNARRSRTRPGGCGSTPCPRRKRDNPRTLARASWGHRCPHLNPSLCAHQAPHGSHRGATVWCGFVSLRGAGSDTTSVSAGRGVGHL